MESLHFACICYATGWNKLLKAAMLPLLHILRGRLVKELLGKIVLEVFMKSQAVRLESQIGLMFNSMMYRLEVCK